MWYAHLFHTASLRNLGGTGRWRAVGNNTPVNIGPHCSIYFWCRLWNKQKPGNSVRFHRSKRLAMCTHLSFSCQSPLTCSVFPYPPVTAMCLQPFCVTLPFFLCFILSILSIYGIRLPQPLAHSHLVLPESVYTGIFISILFYSRTNFLCSNSSPDSVVLL